MSEYTFKNLNEVETVDKPEAGTTIMGFEAGKAIQMPMSAIGGGDTTPFVIDTTASDFEANKNDPAYGDKVKEMLLNGQPVWVYDKMIATGGGVYGYSEITVFFPPKAGEGNDYLNCRYLTLPAYNVVWGNISLKCTPPTE